MLQVRVTLKLHVAAPDGSNDRLVLDGADFQGLYAPRFSPDGLAIYFAAFGRPGDGNGTPTSMRDTQPRTPPGPAEMLLAMIGQPQPRPTARRGCVVGSQPGSGLRRLTSIYEDLPMVARAPDGRQIAIMGYNGIYLSNPDGAHLRQISSAGDHGGLDW